MKNKSPTKGTREIPSTNAVKKRERSERFESAVSIRSDSWKSTSAFYCFCNFLFSFAFVSGLSFFCQFMTVACICLWFNQRIDANPKSRRRAGHNIKTERIEIFWVFQSISRMSVCSVGFGRDGRCGCVNGCALNRGMARCAVFVKSGDDFCQNQRCDKAR